MRSLALVLLGALVAVPAKADDSSPRPLPFWAAGPAGALGFFVEGGGTFGQLGFDAFAAGSLGAGVSLRWFEASVTGFGGSSFDGVFVGGAFLVRAALRLPVRYVAFTLGPSVGAVEVPGHLVSGATFEPLAIGVEIDPVCHLRIGLLGAYAQIYADVPEGALRGALTVGFVTGRCANDQAR